MSGDSGEGTLTDRARGPLRARLLASFQRATLAAGCGSLQSKHNSRTDDLLGHFFFIFHPPSVRMHPQSCC